MPIEDRLPELTDKELENLQANAVRLSDSDKKATRDAAQTLLPLVTEEVARRQTLRTEQLELERARKKAALAERKANRKLTKA